MKKVIILLFLQCFLITLKAQDSLDSGCVVYVDSIYDNSSITRSHLLLGKARHSLHNQYRHATQMDTVYSRKKKIMAIYDPDVTEFTDGVIHCLRMAMDLWEDRINFKFPIIFLVNYTYDLDDDLEIKTSVRYSKLSRFQSRSNSIYSWNNSLQENAQTNIMATYPDTISINANVEWNSAWSYDINGMGSNLITALLRHIGHILGFGSSVITANGTTRFCISGAASDFDRLIVDENNTALSSYCQNQAALISSGYFTHDLRINSPNQYALYSSKSGYIPFRSAMYFSLPSDNIMNYPYGDRTQLRSINHETMDVLKSIGWGQRVSPYNVSIQSSTLDAVGYGSGYATHLFSAVDSAGSDVQSAVWKYQRFSNVTGDYVDVSTSTGSAFSLSPPSVVSDAIDEDKCLQGRIVCTLTNGGEQISYTKPVFLELRPWFTSLEVENVFAPSNSNYFSFDVRVKSLGATSGQLLVCNEYGQVLTYNMNGYNEEVIHVSNVFKFGQTYFDLTQNNSYGGNVKIILYEEATSAARKQNDVPSMAIDDMQIIPIEGEIREDRLFVQDGDSVSLTLSNIDDDSFKATGNIQVSWKLVIPKYNNKKWEYNIGGDAHGCSFKVKPDLVGGSAHNLVYIWDEETDDVYNDGVIRATLRDGEHVVKQVDYPIRLKVLPSMPRVTVVSSCDEYDADMNGFIPVYYLQITASGHKIGIVHSQLGSSSANGCYFFADEPMPMNLRVDWAYPNCFFDCSLINDYGFITSTPVFAEFTGINHPEYQNLSIKQENGTCFFDFGELLDHVLITDLQGKTWCSLNSVSRIEQPLSKGIYLLRLKKDAKINTLKIVIK